MPRRRRVTKTRIRFEYDEKMHALFLTSGHDYFNEQPFGDPVDMDLVAYCWREHRDELLLEYVAIRPGCRPWGWWEFDAPELRVGGESQLDYLERLELLLPSERELMEGKKHDHS